jgi:flagellar FliL protein
MADDEKTMVEVDETNASAAPKKPLPIKKYGIYAAVVLVMVFAAYFVTLKVVKPMLSGGETMVEPARADKDEPKKGRRSHGTQASRKSQDDNNIYMIEQMIVNPAGTGGRRFLSASIGFELGDEAANVAMQTKEAIVRDALITILSSQTVPELSDSAQRERLRKLIRLRVSKLLGTDDISAVYFTEFVLQ